MGTQKGTKLLTPPAKGGGDYVAGTEGYFTQVTTRDYGWGGGAPGKKAQYNALNIYVHNVLQKGYNDFSEFLWISGNRHSVQVDSVK